MTMTDAGQAILEAIQAKHGKVTADLVVEDARDPDHPWHAKLNWDNEAAGHHWRLMQARTLIRSVRYERRTETRILHSPAYIRDPDAAADEQSYVSVVSLRSDEDRARSALLAEFSRVSSALRRAREIADVLGMDGEVLAMLTNVEGLRETLRIQHNGPTAPQ
jgi:hypothetical protein